MTTTKPARKCMQGRIGRTSYCGRSSTPIVPTAEVTCENCLAAFRADERNGPSRR